MCVASHSCSLPACRGPPPRAVAKANSVTEPAGTETPYTEALYAGTAITAVLYTEIG